MLREHGQTGPTCDLWDALQGRHRQADDDTLAGPDPQQALTHQQAGDPELACCHTHIVEPSWIHWSTTEQKLMVIRPELPAVRWAVRGQMLTSCRSSSVSVWNRWMEEPRLKAIHTPPPDRTMWFTLQLGLLWAWNLCGSQSWSGLNYKQLRAKNLNIHSRGPIRLELLSKSALGSTCSHGAGGT